MILHICALAPLIPISSAVILPVVSRLSTRARDFFSVFATCLTLVFTALMIPEVFSVGRFIARYSWILGLDVEVVVVIDALSMLMANIASFLGLLAVLYSIEYMKDEENLTRYYAFVLLFIGAMIGLVLSVNLLQFFLFWELVSVCSFFLIGFWYEKPSAVKAATKAFLVTRIGSLCLLLGMLWIYNYAHSFDLVAMSELVQEIPFGVLQVCSLLFLFGAMSKSAQLPFHIWLPDAMEAPTPVSALIHAATMVNGGVYLIARVSSLFSSVSFFFTLSMYVGVFTAFLAATMALVTDDIKRLLAFSTISQLGYVMFILGMQSSLGYFAGLFHMFNHALFKALLFLCAGVVIHAVHTRDMNRMGGLWRSMPVTFVMSLGGAMALSGLPPFNGFFSKELILDAAEGAGHPFLTGIAAATSAFTFAYSLKLIYKVFLGNRRPALENVRTPSLITICLRILGAACIFSVLTEEPLIMFFGKSGLISIGAAVTPYGSLQLEPLLSSVGALMLGLAAFLLREHISKFLTTSHIFTKIVGFINRGYGFDKLCNRLSQLMISTALTIYTWRFFDRLYAFLGRLMAKTASRFRKIQTGFLGWNMIMVLIGILGIILLIVLHYH